MRQLALIIVLVVGFISHTSAQFNPEARVFLDEALTKLKSGSGIEMQYVLSQINQNEAEEISSGTVFMKGDLYRVESDEFMVIFDGIDQWIYRPDDEELMIQKPDSSSMDEGNPVNMLTSYKTGYKFDLKEETDSAVLINMIAQDPFSPYILVTVKLNKVKKEFVSLQMVMRDENALKINLKYIATGKKFNANFFNFSALKLPVLETIDLREN